MRYRVRKEEMNVRDDNSRGAGEEEGEGEEYSLVASEEESEDSLPRTEN